MTIHFLKLRKAIIGTTMALAAVMTASCVSTGPSSPKQLEMTNPTVTYQYRNDDELIQANQRAVTFCEPHQSLPQAQSFSNDSDDRRIVVFECVPSLQAAQTQGNDSSLRYNYRTDQQLLDASRDTQVYCSNSGKPEMASNIVTNSDGSKTVTFHCSPR